MNLKEFDKLIKIADELRPYYDIDKIKPWSVYVWSKSTPTSEGDNIFDITKNKIICYGNFKEENIVSESLPIIKKIQEYLKN